MQYYYYEEDGQAMGPLTLAELKSKRINRNTLVWTEGMDQWAPAEKVQELKGLIVPTPPPLPPPLPPTKSESEKAVNIESTHRVSPRHELKADSEYMSVKIGSQIWMAENLNVDRFRNGDPIPQAITAEEWDKAGEHGEPAWCFYDNNPANGKKYGKLYNWFAANDPRGLAPNGWHVASDEEWTELIDYLGGKDVADTKMKSKNGWDRDGNGSNQSGFTALPGGERISGKTFTGKGSSGNWWSSTEHSSEIAWYWSILGHTREVYRNKQLEKLGYSIRCLKD